MAKHFLTTSKINARKQMNDLIKDLCDTRASWQVWSDFVIASSCALANTAGGQAPHFQEREQEYAECVSRLGGVERAAELFACLVEAYEEDQEQDFLGSIFMDLNLGSHWKGQFFTPYSICKMMSAMNADHMKQDVEQKGWVSICDPACGAGATLIAAANELRAAGVNYQNHALFAAQDVDRVAGLMCYMQMTILGMPGYVVIGNTLTNPMVGQSPLLPMEAEGQELWITPMFLSDVWEMRRRCKRMDMILQGL